MRKLAGWIFSMVGPYSGVIATWLAVTVWPYERDHTSDLGIAGSSRVTVEIKCSKFSEMVKIRLVESRTIYLAVCIHEFGVTTFFLNCLALFENVYCSCAD